jgi:hypothetical protein
MQMYFRIILAISTILLASLSSVCSRLDTPPFHSLARRAATIKRYYVAPLSLSKSQRQDKMFALLLRSGNKQDAKV